MRERKENDNHKKKKMHIKKEKEAFSFLPSPRPVWNLHSDLRPCADTRKMRGPYTVYIYIYCIYCILVYILYIYSVCVCVAVVVDNSFSLPHVPVATESLPAQWKWTRGHAHADPSRVSHSEYNGIVNSQTCEWRGKKRKKKKKGMRTRKGQTRHTHTHTHKGNLTSCILALPMVTEEEGD